MNSFTPIKPNSTPIKAYHQHLQEIQAQGVSHELATRGAFHELLRHASKLRNLTVVPETSLKVGGKTIRPDALIRDEWRLTFGYYESKDSADDLDSEIRKKTAMGYPLTNTIF